MKKNFYYALVPILFASMSAISEPQSADSNTYFAPQVPINRAKPAGPTKLDESGWKGMNQQAVRIETPQMVPVKAYSLGVNRGMDSMPAYPGPRARILSMEMIEAFNRRDPAIRMTAPVITPTNKMLEPPPPTSTAPLNAPKLATREETIRNAPAVNSSHNPATKVLNKIFKPGDIHREREIVFPAQKRDSKSILSQFIEDNTQKAPHEGYFKIVEVDRWASPSSAIMIWTKMDEINGNSAHRRDIAQARLTIADCSKLEGTAKPVCYGIQKAFKREKCSDYSGDAQSSCLIFQVVFNERFCDEISGHQTALQCTGIVSAIDGFKCENLSGESKETCEGTRRALKGESCAGTERHIAHFMGYASNAAESYCRALTYFGFADYLKK